MTSRAAGRPNQKRRTRKDLLEAAARLMRQGRTPDLEEIAAEALVSRATAYRYFPSQAAMLQAVVDEALGPVLAWQPEGADADMRVAELFAFAFPRMLKYEATHRAALSQALDQWARRQAGTLGAEPRNTGRSGSSARWR